MAIYLTRPSDIEGPLQMEQEKSDKTPGYHEDAALGRPCASAPPQRQACSSTLIVDGTQAASNRAQNVMVQYSARRSTTTDTLACTLIPIWHDFVPVKISFQYPLVERRSHLFAVNDGSLCGIPLRLGALGVNGLWSAILCGASMYHADRSVYYSWGPSS